MTSQLKERRIDKRLTQKELSERAAISRQYLNKIENGKATPSTPVAIELAKALGCTVEDIFSIKV
ncbi:MAG: helix-turn-helix transcriptional regulator [Alkalibacterium sp.]|nr:helix-turn-helix transcriptional regulator [Alkalibacterium sp.]